MCPDELGAQHLAGQLLQQYAEEGCPGRIGPRGNHPSAEIPEAARAIRAEALEKVEQGFARLVPWQQNENGRHLNTEMNPAAAIPHKSRLLRIALDLSQKGQRRRDGKLETRTVNTLTSELEAPLDAMANLGTVLTKVICAVGTRPTSQLPTLFIQIRHRGWTVASPSTKERRRAACRSAIRRLGKVRQGTNANHSRLYSNGIGTTKHIFLRQLRDSQRSCRIAPVGAKPTSSPNRRYTLNHDDPRVSQQRVSAAQHTRTNPPIRGIRDPISQKKLEGRQRRSMDRRQHQRAGDGRSRIGVLTTR